MCFEPDASPPDVPADRRLPHIAGGAAAEEVTVTSADGTAFAAALAPTPSSKGAGVVIIPDVRGLYRFYVELAERFASAGHHAIAIDLFGRTAGVGARGDDFDFMAHLPQTTPEQVQQDVAAAAALLRERTGVDRVAVVGFCFGGAQAFLAATQEDLPIDRVIGFYGTLVASRTGLDFLPSPGEHATATRKPVLGLFGGADDFIPAGDVAAFDEALDTAGVPHEVVVYEGAPHSFFDRSADEHREASEDAWRRVLDDLADPVG
jgi:carboxymethylenebutenolidase